MVTGARITKVLAGWLARAKRSRPPGFVRLAKIEKYRPLIWNALDNRLSNARVEGNEHARGGSPLRGPTQRAYGLAHRDGHAHPCSPAEGPAPDYPAEPHEFTHGNVRRSQHCNYSNLLLNSITTIQTQQHPQARTKSKIP